MDQRSRRWCHLHRVALRLDQGRHDSCLLRERALFADSEPNAELDETRLKLRPLMDLLTAN